jgi:HEPN domain-containing protein
MMTKDEHINYWLKSAKDDWEAVIFLKNSNKNLQALFFAHLVLEKICKAQWVKDNESNIPPKTHNLIKLIYQTKLLLDESTLLFLEEFNDFQLEGRYPDYMFAMSKKCDKIYTESLLTKVNQITQCLTNKIL